MTSVQTSTAQVTEGVLRGAIDGDVVRFRAVPFAAPPVGDRRFRPPAPPVPWTGERDATTRANIVCPRPADNIAERYDGPVDATEDCLLLNVTVPAAPAGAPRPVLVYFHGGAFRSGSAFQTDFASDRLASRGDLVVVTANYRLGVFGWVELGALDPSLAGSGNNGLRDQLAALDWVRANAAAFGGDPDQITVAGQSAGAISIGAMLAGDRPERRFRRAILQSGSGYLVQPRAGAEKTARTWLKLGGITSAADLLARSTDDLLTVQAAFDKRHPITGRMVFAPYVDGDLVPGPPISRVAAGSAAAVEILIGTTRDEATFFTTGSPALGVLPAAANPFFPGALRRQQRRVIRVYGGRADGGALGGAPATAVPPAAAARRRARQSVHERPLVRMLTDQLFRVPAIRTAEAQASHNAATFMYRFDWHAPHVAEAPKANLGATHIAEVPFVFGSLDTRWIPHADLATDVELDARRALSDRMIAAWAAFARTGIPRAADVPDWPAYTATDRQTMLWSTTEPGPASAPDDAQRAAWDAYDFAYRPYALPVG